MHPRRWSPKRGEPLPAADAVSRTSAYVYGNILVLAALVPLSIADVRSGTAVLIVLGTAVSTFFAHLFAETVGGSMRVEQLSGWRAFRHHVRDAVPVLTSGLVPTVLLALAWLNLAPHTAMVVTAEVLLIVRIGWTGVVVGRLHGEPSSLRLLLAGVALSVLGAVVVGLKVLLTH